MRRACRVLDEAVAGAEADEVAAEAETLCELLAARHAALAGTLAWDFPELRVTLWQSDASTQAAVQVRAAVGARCDR